MQRTFLDPITDSCFVDVIDVTLAVEENKSKLVNVVAELMLMVVLMLALMIAFETFPPFIFQTLNISFAALKHRFLPFPHDRFFENVPEYVDNRMIRATPIHSRNS